ncbi:MAG: 50S ribosomal protein L30 [Candidatus Diapherotrites archaeon]|nr:50S ribosomal protein L30 [Candidatus Diapherotrites archaeon]
MSELAVIRVRGTVHINHKIEDTLGMLRLHRVNHCVLLNDSLNNRGMLKKAKDYLTWGTVSTETIEKMLNKRGRIVGNKKLTNDYLKEHSEFKTTKDLAVALHAGKTAVSKVDGVKPVFRLSPPRKGYDRKGIKQTFKTGGVLGNRAEAMDVLVNKMI